jgi:predicted small secreted protein
MSTKKQLLIIALFCAAAFALTGCTSIQATFKDLLKSGIRFLGYLLVISALISGAVLLIQGKVNMIVGSSRGVSEVVVALAAIFAGLILGLLGPVFVDAVYSGLEARSLISNEIPVPFK